MRWHFNLSQNKSFQTLETTARSIATAGEAAPGFLKAVLSTIPSHLPLDVVITYQDFDVDYHVLTFTKSVRVYGISQEERAKNARHHQERFKVFNKMYGVREFRLVLCADVLDCIAKRAMRVLGGIVKAERKKGGLDYLACEPLIISETRVPRTRRTDWNCSLLREREWPIHASAL